MNTDAPTVRPDSQVQSLTKRLLGLVAMYWFVSFGIINESAECATCG